MTSAYRLSRWKWGGKTAFGDGGVQASSLAGNCMAGVEFGIDSRRFLCSIKPSLAKRIVFD